ILENLETLTVNQGEISASTVEGNAGSLSINTNQNPVKTVQLNQGSLAVKATGTGNSGNLTVNAHTVNLQNHSDISASSNSGKGGNITLPQLETLKINNSQISAATATGTAGSININSRQNVELQNQGRITVEATDGGTAGNLTLQTDTLTIADNSLISVSSLTGQAGNITIQTQDLRLNRGAITAETGKAGGESGANINLTVSRFMTLSMDNNSLISATAYGYADGGNVTINTPLLIAQPGTGTNGNDIVAKAFFGDGGRITINALGIFGISEGKALAGNQSNDIDASSEYGASGVITLNQAIDPNRGLVTLPGNVIDPNSLIEQNVCQRRRQGQSQLTTTGKTDLPPSLGDDFQGVDNGVKLVEPSLREGQANAPVESFSQITPAQGWQRLANGKMLLVSEPLQTVTPQRSPVLPSSCFPNL
ncbi:MAG: filamentous hemagglutinin, partial [Microcystaceae cyanobacterium]